MLRHLLNKHFPPRLLTGAVALVWLLLQLGAGASGSTGISTGIGTGHSVPAGVDAGADQRPHAMHQHAAHHQPADQSAHQPAHQSVHQSAHQHSPAPAAEPSPAPAASDCGHQPDCSHCDGHTCVHGHCHFPVAVLAAVHTRRAAAPALLSYLPPFVLAQVPAPPDRPPAV